MEAEDISNVTQDEHVSQISEVEGLQRSRAEKGVGWDEELELRGTGRSANGRS